MRQFQSWAAAASLLTLMACGSNDKVTSLPATADSILPNVQVMDIDVVVPRELVVSEANLYYPWADIVWREDGPGDRYQQVEAIVADAMNWGLAAFNEGRPVDVTVRLDRFHALSQKARYSVGGVHSLKFNLSVVDAETGEQLLGPLDVDADLNALGGQRALDAEFDGLTQKSRITQHLAGTVQIYMIHGGLGNVQLTDADAG